MPVVNLELIDKYAEITRRVQAHAVEQAWSLDWTQFARYRNAEREARTAGNLRGALRNLARHAAANDVEIDALEGALECGLEAGDVGRCGR